VVVNKQRNKFSLVISVNNSDHEENSHRSVLLTAFEKTVSLQSQVGWFLEFLSVIHNKEALVGCCTGIEG
jgi:hypothetical protein